MILQVKDNKEIAKQNQKKGRNILHYFAKYASKSDLEVDYIESLYEEIIMKRKISFLEKDQKGRAPLHLAAQSSFLFLIKKLIEHDVKVDETDGMGRTPLHLATIYQQVEAIQLLIRHGAGIQTIDKHGGSLLTLAINQGKQLEIDKYYTES